MHDAIEYVAGAAGRAQRLDFKGIEDMDEPPPEDCPTLSVFVLSESGEAKRALAEEVSRAITAAVEHLGGSHWHTDTDDDDFRIPDGWPADDNV